MLLDLSKKKAELPKNQKDIEVLDNLRNFLENRLMNSISRIDFP